MAPPRSNRRTFLKILNVAVGGAVAAVASVPILGYLLFPTHPTRRKIVDSPRDPIPVASADAVTDKPLRVEIAVVTQHDAWSVNENVRLGAAWLVRDAKNEIRCFSTTCPHLGCSIDFDAKLDKFKCPCHSSTFDKDGLKLSGPALRGMDPLKTQVDAQGRVLVQFARFKPNTANREDA